MAHEVLMPKLSSTMSEGTITTWLKSEGDSVEIGEAIFEVMTDKIAIEVEAYEEGILLKKYIDNGESAPVNAVIAYIGEVGEKVPENIEKSESSAEVKAAKEIEAIEKTAAVEETKNSTQTANKVRATPAARRLAREKGIFLSIVQGSGPRGRIQRKDVADYQKKEETNSLQANAALESIIPWSGMRKVIAERMQQSSSTIPHVTMNASANMEKSVELRNELLPIIEEQTGYRLSFLEIITKAVTVALKRYPIFNAHALDEGIQKFQSINMGIAVAVEEGLVVPVIKNTEAKGLKDLTQTIKKITEKARQGQLLPEELSGGTFTISSLGKSRVREFTPIINQPEVAILGVGGMYEQVCTNLYKGMDAVQTVPTIDLSLSFDHRVVDGAPAAAFLSYIVEILENPMGLLL